MGGCWLKPIKFEPKEIRRREKLDNSSSSKFNQKEQKQRTLKKNENVNQSQEQIKDISDEDMAKSLGPKKIEVGKDTYQKRSQFKTETAKPKQQKQQHRTNYQSSKTSNCTNIPTKNTKLSSGLPAQIKTNSDLKNFIPYLPNTPITKKGDEENILLPLAKTLPLKVTDNISFSDITKEVSLHEHSLVDIPVENDTIKPPNRKFYTVVNMDQIQTPAIKKPLLPKHNEEFKIKSVSNQTMKINHEHLKQVQINQEYLIQEQTQRLVANMDKKADSALLKLIQDNNIKPIQYQENKEDLQYNNDYYTTDFNLANFASNQQRPTLYNSQKDFIRSMKTNQNLDSLNIISIEPPVKPKRSPIKNYGMDVFSSKLAKPSGGISSKVHMEEGPLQTKTNYAIESPKIDDIDLASIKLVKAAKTTSSIVHMEEDPLQKKTDNEIERPKIDDIDLVSIKLVKAAMTTSSKVHTEKGLLPTKTNNVIERSKLDYFEPSLPTSNKVLRGKGRLQTKIDNVIERYSEYPLIESKKKPIINNLGNEFKEKHSMLLNEAERSLSEFKNDEKANQLHKYTIPNLNENESVDELNVAFVESKAAKMHNDSIIRNEPLKEANKIMELNPQQVFDVRNNVPVFRDYNEINENDLLDDLTENKVDLNTYNKMIETLEGVYNKAKPFHEIIDQFTELENSNKHYYIEESLRRCIDKLDDMFDDIGDIKALRDERKKVYKLIFPMFERLDAKVQENKLRINSQSE